MMSYTMACTALWSSASTLMRRTSPCTRIMGGRPDERCKSEALFFTLKASSWVMSTKLLGDVLIRLTIMTMIGDKLQQVRARIVTACTAVGRDPASVRLLAVSKTFPAEAVREAHAAGQIAFGENDGQEGVAKIEALSDLRAGIEWHCIGPLQSNKTRPVAAHFDWVHSIDRLKIAERLAEQRPAELPPLQVCLQVNVD